jgi:alanyl-tRNA synthetase/misacylated tRNA(Ala) deacylase
MTSIAGKYVKVGALACQRDTFLRTIRATVLSVAAPLPPVKGPAVPAQALEVVLDDTVLFPEGGGQPCDYGTIAGYAVRNVLRRGDMCVHVVDAAPDAAQGALAEGTQVDVVLDWARRWDHVQQHSGQHVLSAVADSMLGLPTQGWGLSSPFCYVQFPVARVAPEDVERLEVRCNELIAASVAFTRQEFATRDEMPASRSRGIPADVTGPIRMIEVGDVDCCTCCGTHVASTAQLQMLKLLHQEAKGNTVRLYFVVGERVRRYFGGMYDTERALCKDLAVAAPGLVAASERRGKDATDAQRHRRKLLQEVAALTAPAVVAAAAAAGPADAVFTWHREDADIDFLQVLAEALAKPVEGAAPRICALACGPTSGDGGAFMLVPAFAGANNATAVAAVSGFATNTFLPALGPSAKGGVSRSVFRGKADLGKWKQFVKSKPTATVPAPPAYAAAA